MKQPRSRNGRWAKGKTILPVLIGGGIIIVMGAFAYNSEPTTYQQTTKEVVVEVTPEWAEDVDAVEAAQAVIRKKELQAELEVLQSEVSEREARITEIEKELGVF